MKRISLFLIGLTLVSSHASAQAPEADDAPADEFVIPEDVAEGYPEYYLSMMITDQEEPESAGAQAISKKLWNRGATLRVCFWGGNAVVKELVANVAQEWEPFSGLDFDFGPIGNRRNCSDAANGFSDIRVGFSNSGYWSLIGTDSRELSADYQTSLNLFGFDRKYRQPRYTAATVVARADPANKGTIRHEFGHAIGLIHEHQNPNINCWNELIKTGPDSVYAYYGGAPNFWTEREVEGNLGLISRRDADAGQFDPKSIMEYLIPAKILTRGASSPCFIEARSNQISDLDKQWVARKYATAPEPLQSDALISDARFAGIPAAASPAVSEDFLARIMADLNSDDASARRDARARLAELLRSSGPETVAVVTNDLADQSYRTQLGVAVAVANAGPAVLGDLTDSAIAQFRTALSRTDDATLQQNLNRVLPDE